MKSALQSTATDSGALPLQTQPGSDPQRSAQCTADSADGPREPAEDGSAGSGLPTTGSIAAAAVRTHASAGSSKADAFLAADRRKEIFCSQAIQEDSIGGSHHSASKKRKRKANRKGKTDKGKQKKGRDGLGIEIEAKAPAAGWCASSDEGLEQLRKAALKWANKADANQVDGP